MKFLPREQWYENNPEDKGANTCPFCEHEKEENAQYVIWKGKHWFICHNKYPILGLTNQLMAIPYRHVILAKDLHKEEYSEFQKIEQFMHEYYKENDYFMFTRESRNSRSLEHLHYHFVPGQILYEDIADMLSRQGF